LLHWNNIRIVERAIVEKFEFGTLTEIHVKSHFVWVWKGKLNREFNGIRKCWIEKNTAQKQSYLVSVRKKVARSRGIFVWYTVFFGWLTAKIWL
jgi:hypothetical protein